MKTQLRGLTLTALLVSASHMTLADDGVDPSVVGDLPGYGEEAYFAAEATYAPSAPRDVSSSVASDNWFANDQPLATAGLPPAAGAVQTVGDLPQTVGIDCLDHILRDKVLQVLLDTCSHIAPVVAVQIL